MCYYIFQYDLINESYIINKLFKVKIKQGEKLVLVAAKSKQYWEYNKQNVYNFKPVFIAL